MMGESAMLDLVYECRNFLNDFGFPYAICGGYAIEMFLGKEIRPHGDLDISIFYEDRKHIVDFILSRGWDIYTQPDKAKYIELITRSDDSKVLNPSGLFAVKPRCTLFELEPVPGYKTKFKFEDTNNRQTDFDFIDIIFNKQQDNKFLFWPFTNRGKNITRELDKAILYHEDIPYLSPEVMLLIISPPEYFSSDYHKDKNCIDFESTIPYLPNESRGWLINALKTVYPEGHRWFEQLNT